MPVAFTNPGSIRATLIHILFFRMNAAGTVAGVAFPDSFNRHLKSEIQNQYTAESSEIAQC